MGQYTEQEKRDWIESWHTSGSSAKRFAADKPFSASSLHYWNRKFKTTSESHFIQVLPEQSMRYPYARLIYPSGVILEICDQVSPEYFKGLLS